jgi:type I restriction enzyme M protein
VAEPDHTALLAAAILIRACLKSYDADLSDMEKLTTDQKKQILAKVRKLDPNGEIVVLSPDASFNRGKIEYNRTSGVTLGENISTLTDEEYVRAYLVVRLAVQLKYPLDGIELEHTYTIGRPSATKAQIDVRVLDRREQRIKTFMLIEAKRPDDFASYTKLIEDQLFATGRDEYARGVRYAVWYTVEFREGEIRDKCIIIDFRKFSEFKDWVEEGEPGHNLELPAEYGTVRKTRYVRGGKTDLRTDLTRRELTQLQKDFHNVLWGGAKMGDTDVFNNLLKMFLAKIYDEHTTDEGQPYRFQSELKDGRPENAEELTAKVNRIYKDALKHYFGYAEETLATAVINENRFPPNKVAYVMERLEDVSITQNKYEDDVLGAFFESIVRTGFKQEKGQFFTHANIVRFILYALELDELPIQMINGASPTLPYIMDTSCGSGTFLIEAVKVVTNSVLNRNRTRIRRSSMAANFFEEFFHPLASDKNSHNRWARTFVYGIDDNEDLAMATKVNMILHGDGNANIQKADGLAAFSRYTRPLTKNSHQEPNAPYPLPVNENFDVIISNPPFSIKEEGRTLSEYATRFAYADRKNSENLFVERWYQFLKPGGRLGVVLPDSVFDTNENLYIRLFLYRFFHLKAVVSLPQVTFQPYTPTKTSLLFAVKKTRREVEAWDGAWRKASNEYGRLRRSEVVKFVLTNERVRNSLIDLANKTEVEWYPAANLISAETLPDGVRARMLEAAKENKNLLKRAAERLKELDELLAARTLENFAEAAREESSAALTELLRDKLPRNAAALSLPELVETAYDDIVEAAELNYTEDPKGQPYCNAWWCFAEVTSRAEFDYEVFFAEAEHVGYKRTTRHPDGIPQPNDLFQTDESGNVVVDTENPRKILDYLRSKRFFFWQPQSLNEADAIRLYHARLSDCRASFTLRFSARYLHPRYRYLTDRVLSVLPTAPLGKYVSRSIQTGAQPVYTDDGVPVIKIATLKNWHLDWSEAQYADPAFFERNKRRAGVLRGDILVSSTGVGSLGKVDVYDSDEPAMATVDVNIVRLAEGKAEPRLLVHLLRHRVAKWQIERELAGSTNQIHIYGDQLARLRLPSFARALQVKLFARTEKIFRQIEAARESLRRPQDIIDEILCREFGYPLHEHTERERERQYVRRFAQFGAGFTLRNSAKFHHPDFELTDRFFARTPHERVKAYVAVPIRLGATAAKSDFVEDGAAFYVHPGATKKQEIVNTEDCHQITQEFYDKNKRRFGLLPGDLVLNRAGEGTIGKSGLFDSEELALFSDFTMRLRFSGEVNSRFAWYFMRSVMFQSQIEREKRGMGNMTNIFPSQVERLLIVESPRDRQDAVAAEVAAELKRREDALRSIESRRREIDALIEAAIKAEITANPSRP